MTDKLPPLRNVQFGKLDASDEADQDPELLLQGYLDYHESVYEITKGVAWFVLGPKGAGKSAVFEHLRLKWRDQWDRFFVPWDLRGFPVADVTQIETGQVAGSSRTQSSWEFLLLLRIFQSLASDQGLEAPPEFTRLLDELKRAGLLMDDWKLSVTRWSSGSSTFKISLGPFGLDVGSTRVGPLEIAAVLRSAIAMVSTRSRHVVCIDGLDSFFLETSDDWSSLAGLVHAVEAVNRLLTRQQLPVSVVCAIRTEAFESLDSTDSNKLKSHTVYLDWSPSGVGASSKLWTLVDTKVQVSQPTIKSFTDSYLSADIGQGPYTRIPDYFLAYTRLLPRDLIALLTHLRDVHPGSTPVSEKEAVRTIQDYSEQYFVGEIRNNLAGILPDQLTRAQKTNAFFDSLKSVKMAEFTMHELQQDLEGDLQETETKLLLRQLFDTGAIGIRTRNGNRVERTDFVYRKASPVAFNARRTFILHHALITAWNKARVQNY